MERNDSRLRNVWIVDTAIGSSSHPRRSILYCRVREFGSPSGDQTSLTDRRRYC